MPEERTPFFNKFQQVNLDSKNIVFAPTPIKLKPFHYEPRNLLLPNIALSHILPEANQNIYDGNILATIGISIIANYFGVLEEFVMSQFALWTLAILYPKMGVISKEFDKNI